ncbi:hypothetical protein EYF80_044443 [Liparis tanakae]|uniref:Uncharacterized protein n=1 Tax=Liparis tanakae TaxID=230148 RepID=A0A4Z2FVW4_9TELE|nr:hypothetical protein EYF80_044443 [Liparis tanakae]
MTCSSRPFEAIQPRAAPRSQPFEAIQPEEAPRSRAFEAIQPGEAPLSRAFEAIQPGEAPRPRPFEAIQPGEAPRSRAFEAIQPRAAPRPRPFEAIRPFGFCGAEEFHDKLSLALEKLKPGSGGRSGFNSIRRRDVSGAFRGIGSELLPEEWGSLWTYINYPFPPTRVLLPDEDDIANPSRLVSEIRAFPKRGDMENMKL